MADEELTAGQRAYRRRLANEAERREESRRLGAAEARAEAAASRSSGAGSRRGPSLPRVDTTDAREAVGGSFEGVNVSKVTARKMVLLAVFVLFALNLFHEQRGDSKYGFYRRIYSTAFVGFFLALVADFAPQIAGPLAVVIVLSQVPRKGNVALQSTIGRVVSGAGAPTAPGAGAPPGPAGPVGTPRPAGAPTGVLGPR